MFFIAEKDPGIIPNVLSQILDASVNGLTLADPDLPDMPIVFVNKAFETISGYPREEVVGKNCRFLQGDDRDQEGRKVLRKAIEECQPAEVTLRNYRKNGELFYNHLAITPLFDQAGKLIYYLGVQYDVTVQVKAEQEIERLSKALESVTRLS